MKDERSRHGRRYSDHLIEKWETLKPNGTKTHLEFELTLKSDTERN
jgi:hypothetical protein